jgi:hypothetical protein
VIPGSDVTFGIQPTPAYEISENAWGYRSLEKTQMDLRSIVDSRDDGLSLRGKIVGDGSVNYWLMVGNGQGTSIEEADKYKRYYANIQFKPFTNFQATIYGDYKSVAPGTSSYTAKALDQNYATGALFLGYSEPFQYNVGVEGFIQSRQNALKDTASKSYSNQTYYGVSVFGSYNIIPELALVARYDYFNPSTDDKATNTKVVTNATSNVARNYVIAGLAWKVDKNVTITPNVLYETYSVPKNAASVDASVTARVTVYYVFL